MGCLTARHLILGEKNLSFLERFSPHVEILYIFCRVTFSPKQRESLLLRENLSLFREILSSSTHFLSVSLYIPLSLYLRCLAVRKCFHLQS
jgi:hypothetical protein